MTGFSASRLLAPLLLAAAASMPAPAAATTLMLFQSPCPSGTEGCAAISNLDSSWIVRSFAFTIPAAGRVSLTFEASMQCLNASTDISDQHGVVDLSGAILTDPKSVPSTSVPSTVRISHRLPPRPQVSSSFSTPVLISTTRVIAYPSGGPKSVVFKLVKNRMDTLTRCTVFTGNFHGLYLSTR